MKPSICGNVGLENNKLSLQSNILEEVKEECLAASISTNDESYERSTSLNLIQVLNHCVDFIQPTNLDVV
jgi:hypothetical protein